MTIADGIGLGVWVCNHTKKGQNLLGRDIVQMPLDKTVGDMICSSGGASVHLWLSLVP